MSSKLKTCGVTVCQRTAREEILLAVGLPPDGPFPKPADIHPGNPRSGEPEERIKDLDEDGVWGEVLFPNMGINGLCATNAAVRMPFARVYNDWIADTYHAIDPKRFAAIAIIPLGPRGDERVDDAVAEIRRVGKKGLHAILLPASPPAHKPYSLPMYDPIWEMATEYGMVVTNHLGTSAERFFPEWEDLVDANCPDPDSWTGSTLGPSGSPGVPERPFIGRPCPEMPPGAHIATLADSCLKAALCLAWFAAGGIFQRFPDLHLVAVEGGAGWLGWLMDNLDTYYYRGTTASIQSSRRSRASTCSVRVTLRLSTTRLPSQIFGVPASSRSCGQRIIRTRRVPGPTPRRLRMSCSGIWIRRRGKQLWPAPPVGFLGSKCRPSRRRRHHDGVQRGPQSGLRDSRSWSSLGADAQGRCPRVLESTRAACRPDVGSGTSRRRCGDRDPDPARPGPVGCPR